MPVRVVESSAPSQVSVPVSRPSMQQVMQYLEGHAELPELSSLGISVGGLTFAQNEGFDDFAMSYPSSMDKTISQTSSMAESLLSRGIR